MYEPPYFDQSRMSKAWVASNFDTLNRRSHHIPLQAGLSNASNVSRHSQMTNYLTPVTPRPGVLAPERRLAPPLVTSTPYTRQVGFQPPRLGSGMATISYKPRTAPNQRYYQREDARALWQPPPNPSRQTVVAFNKTPIFYDPQPQFDEEEPPPPSVYRDSSYFNAPIGSRSVPPVKRTIIRDVPRSTQFQGHHRGAHHAQHLSSSGGDSCCSSCCSLTSTHDAAARQRSFGPPKAPPVRESCDSFSCSSTCSSCSCRNNRARVVPKKPVPIIKYTPQQFQPVDSRTLTRSVRSRAERRRTIGGSVSQTDIMHAQSLLSNETTPTPGEERSPSGEYCNEACLTIDRQSQQLSRPSPNGSLQMKPRPKPRVMPPDTHTTSSRDSGIGAMTPASQTYAQDLGAPPTSRVSYNNSNLVKTSSGSASSSVSSSVKNVSKTIAVAGDSRASTTIYATTVQTPTSARSSRSSVFLRLQEVRSSKAPPAEPSTLGSGCARNSSQSSTSSSKQKFAGGQVRVTNSATRVVPVPGPSERFIWIDGEYEETEAPPEVVSAALKTSATSDRKRTGPVQAAVIQPSKVPPQNHADDSQNASRERREKASTLSRKNSSFFKNILTSLFGIRPRQHSDGDADDTDVKVSKQRRPANRSASAVFSRGAFSKQRKNARERPLEEPRQSQKSDKSATSDRNRTWHGLKTRNKKSDARDMFDSDAIQNEPQHATKIGTSSGNLTTQSSEMTISHQGSNYATVVKDENSSTLGRTSQSTLGRPVSRGTSLASTLKSSASARGGPLFLVKRRVGSTRVSPVPPAAPGTNDPENPTGEPALIANVEQLLAMARVHPTLEYEWIPDDYFI